jgi:hypothetical protein
MGRPSIDPELMMRMLIVGYCFGIRSERRLCEEVHLTLDLFQEPAWPLLPSSPSRQNQRYARFARAISWRKLFETVVARCMKEGIVGREFEPK